MRKIVAIKPLENFMLEVIFENECIKLFDFKNYLQLPIFKELNDFNKFCEVKNKFYFIEWESYELDLSADTLWHCLKHKPFVILT